MNYFDEGKNADDNFNNNDIESTENQGTDSIRDVSDNDIPDKDKYNNNSENDTDNGCETGEYEYGISYSSSGVEDNTGNLKAPKNSTKARNAFAREELPICCIRFFARIYMPKKTCKSAKNIGRR